MPLLRISTQIKQDFTSCTSNGLACVCVCGEREREGEREIFLCTPENVEPAGPT